MKVKLLDLCPDVWIFFGYATAYTKHQLSINLMCHLNPKAYIFVELNWCHLMCIEIVFCPGFNFHISCLNSCKIFVSFFSMKTEKIEDALFPGLKIKLFKRHFLLFMAALKCHNLCRKRETCSATSILTCSFCFAQKPSLQKTYERLRDINLITYAKLHLFYKNKVENITNEPELKQWLLECFDLLDNWLVLDDKYPHIPRPFWPLQCNWFRLRPWSLWTKCAKGLFRKASFPKAFCEESLLCNVAQLGAIWQVNCANWALLAWFPKGAWRRKTICDFKNFFLKIW